MEGGEDDGFMSLCTGCSDSRKASRPASDFLCDRRTGSCPLFCLWPGSDERQRSRVSHSRKNSRRRLPAEELPMTCGTTKTLEMGLKDRRLNGFLKQNETASGRSEATLSSIHHSLLDTEIGRALSYLGFFFSNFNSARSIPSGIRTSLASESKLS
ncbi:hypothetical protein CEXT_646001 [Caerostris extrusa]|uniref:Uncharacterized protein n=1 Tax=Caerostris extrusa TaxID=172846 RepID=A0AAV4MF24_CAEEX|nr:hypothetical protein CEXT_646001 [Caerostris extrusa]